MKPLVIYHDNCADGFGAAFAAWLKLGDEAEYIPCQYGSDADGFDTEQVKGRRVYILDFSFPQHKMLEIHSKCDNMVWLDHHISAQPLLGVLQDAEEKRVTVNLDQRGIPK